MDDTKISENSIKIKQPLIQKLSNLNTTSKNNTNSAKKKDSSQNISINNITFRNPENNNSTNQLNIIQDNNPVNQITKFNLNKKLEKFPIVERYPLKQNVLKKTKSQNPITSNFPKLENRFSLNNINSLSVNKNILPKNYKSFRKINSYSYMIKNNNNISNLPKQNSSKKKLFKFSEFYKKSKDKDISARKIYDHYIGQESKKIIKPISNFTKFIEKKFKIPKNRFKKIYCLDKDYLQNLKEMKCNKYIAFKKDFEIKEYQNALLEMMSKKLDRDRLYCLQQDFQKFNEILDRGCVSPKGRFSNLADKISNHAPLYLINKLKKLDQENLKVKAKRYKLHSRSVDDNNIFDIDSMLNGINISVLPILEKK